MLWRFSRSAALGCTSVSGSGAWGVMLIAMSILNISPGHKPGFCLSGQGGDFAAIDRLVEVEPRGLRSFAGARNRSVHLRLLAGEADAYTTKLSWLSPTRLHQRAIRLVLSTTAPELTSVSL